MKKYLLLSAALLMAGVATQAQVGIGTDSPNESAALDIQSSNKGFLPPRVTLISETDGVTIPNPATGLTVYHSGNADLEAGLYSNVGTPASPSWNKAGQNVVSENQGGKFYKLIYRGATDSNRTLEAGDFEWRMVLGDPQLLYLDLEVRLREAPTGTVTINNAPRLGWTQNISTTIPIDISWTAADWNTWKKLDFQAQGASHIIYFSPTGLEDVNFYRISYQSNINQLVALLVEVF